MRKQIKKLLVSDKVYKNSPPKVDNRPKILRPPHQNQCYCNLDKTSLDDKKETDDDKDVYDFSRKTEKRDSKQSKLKDKSSPPVFEEDISNQNKHSQQPRSDENNFDDNSSDHSLNNEEEPREEIYRYKMSPQDIEILRKFRDKNYFDCHSIKSKKTGLPKQKHPEYETNRNMYNDPSLDNRCKCKCCCCHYKNRFNKEEEKRYTQNQRDDSTESSSDQFVLEPPPCCCQNNRTKSSVNRDPRKSNRKDMYEDSRDKRHRQEHVLSSDDNIPKYILKIPEVCIKIPITDNMIVPRQSERNSNRQHKHRCSFVKDTFDITYKENRRRQTPEMDSLALRYQKGYRNYE